MIRVALVALLLIAACATDVDRMDAADKDHMGCQEGEILKDGTCLPADENNAQLFGRDLSGVVTTERVTDPPGYYVEPATAGDYPGVVMIHEWWGLNENIEEMARILAAEGYRVFAVDLYDGSVATESGTARELATSVRQSPEAAIATMEEALAYLRERGATRLASLGWCFGGQQSLQLSLNEPLDATVIYYGQLTTDVASLDGPVLGIFGAEDGSIPVSEVEAFEAALQQEGVENDIIIYPGVGHAFANPSGSNYAPEETRDAWARTLAFLRTELQQTS